MVYQNITETMFKDSFHALRPDNFSYQGLSELYHYLTDMSEDCGDMELDVIAICCEFSQEHYTTIIETYGLSLSELAPETDDEEQIAEAVLQWLCSETCVIGGVLEDNTILYQVF